MAEDQRRRVPHALGLVDAGENAVAEAIRRAGEADPEIAPVGRRDALRDGHLGHGIGHGEQRHGIAERCAVKRLDFGRRRNDEFDARRVQAEQVAELEAHQIVAVARIQPFSFQRDAFALGGLSPADAASLEKGAVPGGVDGAGIDPALLEAGEKLGHPIARASQGVERHGLEKPVDRTFSGTGGGPEPGEAEIPAPQHEARGGIDPGPAEQPADRAAARPLMPRVAAVNDCAFRLRRALHHVLPPCHDCLCCWRPPLAGAILAEKSPLIQRGNRCATETGGP